MVTMIIIFVVSWDFFLFCGFFGFFFFFNLLDSLEIEGARL